MLLVRWRPVSCIASDHGYAICKFHDLPGRKEEINMKSEQQEQTEHLVKRVELLCISDTNDIVKFSYGLQQMGQLRMEDELD